MAMPVLAIGLDVQWRARMQRLLAARGELEWLGAFAPAQPRSGQRTGPALLLLDGDDPRTERACRRPLLPTPRRVYFYREPTVAALLGCIAAHASGCLHKQARPDVVLRAIRAAESGLFVTTPRLLLEAMGEFEASDETGAAANAMADGSALTGRQREIVSWAGRGMSNKQIARKLQISPETVKSHLQHAFQRGGVHSRTALAVLARTVLPPP
jgi:DNA-binding NarL/FixJ family response regulator